MTTTKRKKKSIARRMRAIRTTASKKAKKQTNNQTFSTDLYFSVSLVDCCILPLSYYAIRTRKTTETFIQTMTMMISTTASKNSQETIQQSTFFADLELCFFLSLCRWLLRKQRERKPQQLILKQQVPHLQPGYPQLHASRVTKRLVFKPRLIVDCHCCSYQKKILINDLRISVMSKLVLRLI